MEEKVTPEWVRVCLRGHVTDSRTESDLGFKADFSYEHNCRRKNPAYSPVTKGRCGQLAFPLRDYPELEAVYKLGGEPAVRAMIEET